jgi:hypothetical protein
MLPHYAIDRIALERDPNLANLVFDAGSHSTAYESDVGQAIFALLTSRLGVAMLIGAVCSARSRPPVVGIEPLLASQLGDAAFTDPMKRLTGRIVRYVIEHVGGEYETRGVRVTEELGSHYKSGSTYTFEKIKPRIRG